MQADESKDIRKLALINMKLTEENIPLVFQKMRDVDSEIQKVVYQKLIKDRVSLANMNLCDIYKVIYDGLGSRNNNVSNECINYLR